MALTELTPRNNELVLTILAVLAAGASVNFFILGTAGAVSFSDYRNYILIPSFFILLFIVIYGYKKNRQLAKRLVTGLWIGVVATLALEAVRIPSISLQWIPHDDMVALPGRLLTNPPTIQDFNAMIRPHEEKGATMQQHENNNNMKMKDSMKTESVPDTSLKTAEHDAGNAMNDNLMVEDSLKKSDSMLVSNQEQQQQQQQQQQRESAQFTSSLEKGNPTMSMSNDNNNSSQTTHTMMMQDSMQASTTELIVGGLYHFWNGATMAAVYTLVLGKGKWYYGLIWGFIINIGMMLAPWMIPMVGPFGINYSSGYTIFIATLLAHLAYGAVTGLLARRFIKDKGSLSNIIRLRERRLA